MRNFNRYGIAVACLAGVAFAERDSNQSRAVVLENGDPGKSDYCWARFAGNARGDRDIANVALATRITPQLLGTSSIVNDAYAGGTAFRDRASIVRAAASVGGILVYSKAVGGKPRDTVRKVSLIARVNTAKTMTVQNRDFTIGAVRVELRANAIGQVQFNVALDAQSTEEGPLRMKQRSGNMSLKGYCVSGASIVYECRGGGLVIGPASGGDQRVRGTISTPVRALIGEPAPLAASFNPDNGGRLSGTQLVADWSAYAAKGVDIEAKQPDNKWLRSHVLDANGRHESGSMRLVE